MSKHTPAPWYYQEGSDAYTHIVRTGEISRDNPHVGRRFLCQLAQTTTGESEANARLIAAAPDLLDACKVAIGHMTGGMDGDWRDCDPVEVLRAAIAKAEAALTTSQRAEK